MALPSLDGGEAEDAKQDVLDGLSAPPIDLDRKPGAIDVPFEIVVVCRRNDVLLHPGGYRITAKALASDKGHGEHPEPLLQRELRAIVRKRAQVDPLIRPKPRVKFLVETGGSSTFWTARRRLSFSNLNWPMTVQIAGPQPEFWLDERIRR